LSTGYQAAKQLYRVIRQDWPLARRVARIINNEAIDLVHNNNTLFGNRATVIAARLAGVPQICHIRMLQDLSPVEKYLAGWVDRFIYISTAVEAYCRKQGIPFEKGRVIFDPIDVETFGQVNHCTELRAEFGLTQRDRLITNVGRLDWWKGHDYFLQAMAEVIQAQPHTKALIVGAPVSNGPGQTYYQRLQQLVAELRLSNHVIFTGLRADIPRVMAASDIVVHSASEPEPLGRVIVEGMAAGRPVVATAAGGVLDIIQDQVTGLLVPPKNAGLMAKAIRQLLENPEQAKLMGQQAQRDAKKRFSIKEHVAEVQHIYREVLTNRNS
jgi:glycosyltransferase involved in cell wall biosynthesis